MTVLHGDEKATAARTLRAAAVPLLHPIDAFDVIDAGDDIHVERRDGIRYFHAGTVIVAVTDTGRVYSRRHGEPLHFHGSVVKSAGPAVWVAS